jgi:hypothetical protein
MITTLNVRAWREAYGRLEAILDNPQAADGAKQAAQELIDLCDASWKAVAGVFRSEGYSADTSDNAEALTGVILWYLIESNPSFRQLIPAEAAEPIAMSDEEKSAQYWISNTYPD